MTKVDSAKAKLDEIAQRKSELATQNKVASNTSVPLIISFVPESLLAVIYMPNC